MGTLNLNSVHQKFSSFFFFFFGTDELSLSFLAVLINCLALLQDLRLSEVMLT